jgi:hypothetical protein
MMSLDAEKIFVLILSLVAAVVLIVLQFSGKSKKQQTPSD